MSRSTHGFSVKECTIQLRLPPQWSGSLSLRERFLGVVGHWCSVPAKLPRHLGGRKPLTQVPGVTGLSRDDWPADNAPGFLSGPHLELAVGANLCLCCKWCKSSPGHLPSCLPGISLWYLLPRKKGERWRTVLGHNACTLEEALNEAPALFTEYWGYRGEEEEPGEKCHMPCGLWKKLKFIFALHTTFPDALFPSYPVAFPISCCSILCSIGSYL